MGSAGAALTFEQHRGTDSVQLKKNPLKFHHPPCASMFVVQHPWILRTADWVVLYFIFGGGKISV